MKQTLEYLRTHISEINVLDDATPFYDSLDRAIDDLEIAIEVAEFYRQDLSAAIGDYAIKYAIIE